MAAELGNVGSLTGPPFFEAVADRIGASNLAVQGVEYDASIAGFLVRGSPVGTAELSGLIAQAQSQCPQTQLVLSGYSQGAQVVHNTADRLRSEQSSRISSVVVRDDEYEYCDHTADKVTAVW